MQLALLLIIVIAFLSYKLRKVSQAHEATGQLLDCAVAAGLSGMKVEDFVDLYGRWLGELPFGSQADKSIFSLYDRHRLPRPEYPVMNKALKNAMIEEMKPVALEARKKRLDPIRD